MENIIDFFMRKFWLVFILILSFVFLSFKTIRKNFGFNKKIKLCNNTLLMRFGGVRASEYGIKPFPTAEEWTRYSVKIASKFRDFKPAVIWIVGVAYDNGSCGLNFPSDGKEYPYISFAEKDENEEYLSYFDNLGINVFLQVEPGDADIPTLINLMLKRYGKHPSVVGFGVDIEWYKWSKYEDGKPVSDEEVKNWVNLILSFNKNYALFLKHWEIEKMPPEFKEHLIFINDSQGFSSLGEMIDEFQNWGNYFSSSPVAFQIGYEADKNWWQYYYDPAGKIGDEILKNIPNCNGIYWVDFTLKDAFIKRKRGIR